MSSNHGNNAVTPAASKTDYSIWYKVVVLRCLSCVYITDLEESSWIFMPHCNWILSMKWNTALLETYLPWDINLNLHIVHCIQMEMLQTWTCRCRFEDTSSFLYISTWFQFSGKRMQHNFCFSFCSDVISFVILPDLAGWIRKKKRVHCFLLSSKTAFFKTVLWQSPHALTQCMGSMNTASFSSHIKITAFSLPWSNNWRKHLDLFFPYGCKSHFYSTRYYVQTNSKSTFPVYFSIITIKFIFYDGWMLKYIKTGLRIALPSWPLSFELNVNTGVKQNVTSYSTEYKCVICWYRWVRGERDSSPCS